MQNENLDITEQKKPASRMKYLQLVDYINSLIEDGTLQIGDQIPSLNQLQTQLRMSKAVSYTHLDVYKRQPSILRQKI